MGSFYQGMNVAVLGGAGMIGSQLCEILAEMGANVTAIDDLSRGRRQNVRAPVKFVKLDVTGGEIRSHLLKMDCVFNLAARVTGMHYNRRHHAEMFSRNILVETVPLMLAARLGVKRFLQCSTVCVYPRDMEFPVAEAEGHRGEPEPTNEGYGWAKRMGERLASWVYEEYQTKVTVTRFSNCFGPRDYFDDQTSHVIPALIKRALSDEEEHLVYGTGKQIREFLYSRDAALGAALVMQHSYGPAPINIGNPDNRVTIAELAKLIQEVVGVSKPLKFNTTIEDGYPRRGSDIEKLIHLTGWQPPTSLKDGLERTVEWYRRLV